VGVRTRRQTERVRVVIAKLGLDGHDRGALVVSRLLRDAGMEVIYTGIRQSPDKVCSIAQQEDAHVVGISILSGAHRTLLSRLMEGMKSRKLEIQVVVGGIIPDDDMEYLRSLGISAVFPPGSPAADIVNKIDELARQAKD
jgi:methylmalonyl-CoA mutase C-terminal domain/subunit